MKRVLFTIVGFFVVQTATPTARASIINFDDITTLQHDVPVPSNYVGLQWGPNWIVEGDGDYHGFYGNSYGSPSGSYAVTNANGVGSVAVSSDIDFDFYGGYFASFSRNDEFMWGSSTSVTLEGYNNGFLIYSQEFALSPDHYEWLGVAFLGVDEIRVLNEGIPANRWWMGDNFAINEPGPSSNDPTPVVPEPATLLLLAAGLLGLVVLRRRTCISH
jgi:hypothetical protein